MTLVDQQSREKALNVHRSFLVRSPAGSGKTQLLTLRFLALLSNVERDPEEVLAITFTRKAAAEMRERILNILLEANEDTPLPSDSLLQQARELAQKVLLRDRQENWHLLDHPSRLKIQTIDAFCASLVRQMPISSQFSPYLPITDDPSFLYLQAARATLNEIDYQESWSASIEQLLLHLDNSHEKIEKLLVDMLARRDQWLHYLPQIQQSDRSRLEEGFAVVVQDHLLNVVNTFPPNYKDELLSLLQYAASNLPLEHPFAIFSQCTQFPNNDLKNYPMWRTIADFLLTKEGQWRSRMTQQQGFPADKNGLAKEMKAKVLDMLNVLSENEPLRDLLNKLSFLPPLHYSEQQWLAASAWLKILPVLLAHLKLLFQREAVVDYVEVSLKSQEALGELDSPSELALFLDHQIRHILVDEFQDTSLSQWHLLEKMTAGWLQGDGKTLFLVGDPMQSIYRFRKAEVGLFLRAAKEGIHEIQLEQLTLEMNFRSRGNLVDWVSELFVNLMPSQEDSRSGAIKFIPSIPAKLHENTPSVTWYPLVNGENQVEAKKIVSIVQSIFHDHPQAHIAILVKARTHAQPIFSLLREANVSYQAMELEQLESRPVISDLLALTRAFLNPIDRIAWLAVLRAPWCGLDLNDLHCVAGVDAKKTIWERLADLDSLSLSEEGKVRLTYFRAIMSQNLIQKGSLGLSASIEKIWYELNGPLCITDLNEEQNSKVFFEILDEFDTAGDIQDISRLEQRLSNRYATSIFMGNSPVVEIMTIHKAKGLEFDHVILPGLEKGTKQDDAQLLLWSDYVGMDKKNYLILGPIKDAESKSDPIYTYLQQKEMEKARHEMLRLFYVAVTRAKQSLHLLGTVDYQTSIGLKKPSKQSFLGQIWPHVETIFNEALAKTKAMEESVVKTVSFSDSRKLKRLKKDFFNVSSVAVLPHFVVPLHSTVVPRFMRGIQEKFKYFLDPAHKARDDGMNSKQHFAQSIGTVIHQNLQYFSSNALFEANPTTTYRQALLELGISLTDIDNAVSLVEQALKNTLMCERGRWIFSSDHKDIHAEYPINYLEEGRLLSSIIDRTFVDEKNVRWIIDFKTVLSPVENISIFLNTQKKIYQPQLEHYAKLMQALDNRSIRLGLYFPLQSAWVEWEVEKLCKVVIPSV